MNQTEQNLVTDTDMLRLMGWLVIILEDEELILCLEDRELLETLREPEENYTEYQAKIIEEFWEARKEFNAPKTQEVKTAAPTHDEQENIGEDRPGLIPLNEMPRLRQMVAELMKRPDVIYLKSNQKTIEHLHRMINRKRYTKVEAEIVMMCHADLMTIKRKEEAENVDTGN